MADKYRFFAYGLLHDIGIALPDVALPEALDRMHRLIQETKYLCLKPGKKSWLRLTARSGPGSTGDGICLRMSAI